MIELITAGLVAIANGAQALLSGALSPVTAMGIVTAVSLIWLAAVDYETTNRKGTKPRIGRH